MPLDCATLALQRLNVPHNTSTLKSTIKRCRSLLNQLMYQIAFLRLIFVVQNWYFCGGTKQPKSSYNKAG